MKKLDSTTAKELFRNSTHGGCTSHDVQVTTVNGKTVKMTYTSKNASEHFSVEIFDGFKFNHILGMLDLGVTADTSAYVKDASYRKARANDLIKKGHAAIALFI